MSFYSPHAPPPGPWPPCSDPFLEHPPGVVCASGFQTIWKCYCIPSGKAGHREGRQLAQGHKAVAWPCPGLASARLALGHLCPGTLGSQHPLPLATPSPQAWEASMPCHPLNSAQSPSGPRLTVVGGHLAPRTPQGGADRPPEGRKHRMAGLQGPGMRGGLRPPFCIKPGSWDFSLRLMS